MRAADSVREERGSVRSQSQSHDALLPRNSWDWTRILANLIGLARNGKIDGNQTYLNTSCIEHMLVPAG